MKPDKKVGGKTILGWRKVKGKNLRQVQLDLCEDQKQHESLGSGVQEGGQGPNYVSPQEETRHS